MTINEIYLKKKNWSDFHAFVISFIAFYTVPRTSYYCTKCDLILFLLFDISLTRSYIISNSSSLQMQTVLVFKAGHRSVRCEMCTDEKMFSC